MGALQAPVRITVDPESPMRPFVVVDGHDITEHISSYTITHTHGRLPQIVLEGHKLDVVFEGIGEVAIVAPQVAVGEAAATFLSAMDAETVQRLALDAHGWVDGDLIAVALQVLVDLARGGDGKLGRPGG